jgi:hypothetical protein
LNFVILGQELSAEAAATTSAGEIFDLFFTNAMLEIIVLHTNK